MNPHSKHQPLFFTPRSPWGGRLRNQSFRRHMRAHENGRELPEEDKDGRFQGKIESTGETHGKPENSFEFQVNSNPSFRETGRQSDFLGEGRPNKQRMQEQEGSPRKSTAQQQAEWVDRKTREAYARFLESQKKPGNASP